MEFFNNKENEILKFKINSEGIDVNNIETRLILTTKENKNVLLIGKIDKDICRFAIPELNLYEKGNSGKIKFEIISEDLYFPVWEDNFEIKSKATLKVEELIHEIQKTSKPSITVSEAKIETNPKEIKKIVKEGVDITKNETFSKLESVFEKNVPIIEEDKKEKKEDKSDSILKFDNFS